MKKILLTLILVTTLISCNPIFKNANEPLVKEIVVVTKEIVVVQRISLSSGKYQSFIVSGKGFKFETNELTFGIKDTIVIQGDNVYPKNDPTQTIKKNWL